MMFATSFWLNAQILQAGSDLQLPAFNGPAAGGGIMGTQPSDVSYVGYENKFRFYAGGIFLVNLRMLLLPGTAEGGIDIVGDAAPGALDILPRTQRVLNWKAGAGYSFHQGSVTIYANAGECFALRYSSSAPAEINPDDRYSRFTIAKVWPGA